MRYLSNCLYICCTYVHGVLMLLLNSKHGDFSHSSYLPTTCSSHCTHKPPRLSKIYKCCSVLSACHVVCNKKIMWKSGHYYYFFNSHCYSLISPTQGPAGDLGCVREPECVDTIPQKFRSGATHMGILVMSLGHWNVWMLSGDAPRRADNTSAVRRAMWGESTEPWRSLILYHSR